MSCAWLLDVLLKLAADQGCRVLTQDAVLYHIYSGKVNNLKPGHSVYAYILSFSSASWTFVSLSSLCKVPRSWIAISAEQAPHGHGIRTVGPEIPHQVSGSPCIDLITDSR